MTAKEIKQALEDRYGFNCANIVLQEFRPGIGYGKDAERYMDVYTISMSNPIVARAFEIKVSRSDFQSELKNPEKRRLAMHLSHEMYFVAPKGIIREDEVPVDCGLIECTYGMNDKLKLRVVRQPLFRETSKPTWRFVAAIARACSRISTGSLEKQLKESQHELYKLQQKYNSLQNEHRFKDVYSKLRKEFKSGLPEGETELPTK